MQKRFPIALIVIYGSHTRIANRKLTFSTPLSLQAMQWSQSVFEVGFGCEMKVTNYVWYVLLKCVRVKKDL